MTSENKTNVFISYSWDGPDHQEWVVTLSEIIEKHGGNPIIDKALRYGGHLRLFMERNIKASDVVLLVLTPKYKDKAQNLKGGVGYEYNIITKDLFKIIDTNEKYIGVLREGDHDSSVPDFIEDFKYVDLRSGATYDDNLEELIRQILKTPQKSPEQKDSNKPIMEDDYKDLKQLVAEMKVKVKPYFEKIFNTSDHSQIKRILPDSVNAWEKEVAEYSEQLIQKFNPGKMKIAESFPEDFKNNVFGSSLWTVRAALKTKDPDLARYKSDYREADSEEIFDTVNGILNATHKYVNDTVKRTDYNKIETVESLQLQYLDEEDMFMNKIIGYGIRSELLHRYYPAYFPVMTQKSLWAMYFVCDSSKEFITIEQKNRKGIMRVSHNWQYPYDRFTFLMNELALEILNWFKEYGVKFTPDYRFGYVNIFLAEIHRIHRDDIRLLHEWGDIE